MSESVDVNALLEVNMGVPTESSVDVGGALDDVLGYGRLSSWNAKPG